MSRSGRLWRTVRHLQARQSLYQVVNRLRPRPRLQLPPTAPVSHFLTVPPAEKTVSFAGDGFTFLNQPVTFRKGAGEPMRIDWNYAANGKLWTYNLNYFDFLNQPGLAAEAGLELMRDFVAQTERLIDGLEPYPTSLRLINWVQFLSRNNLTDPAIDAHAFAQATLLRRRLEYHLAGNHLLENGFALLTVALYFRRADWLRQATALVRQELTTQVLADGGHDERSPMYQQILLDRLLDVLLALQHDTWSADAALVAFLTDNAVRMLAWLERVTFANGDVPMVNDAAPGIAPTTAQLRAKAARMSLSTDALSRREHVGGPGETGYRMMRGGRYALFVDAGAVGPDHQPGHAHADTFSFVLYVDGRPLFVDSGTSTYQVGPRRAWERSTAAHNTVEVGGQNSSEVWGGFRVGRRARVRLITDTDTTLSAVHDGYRHLGIDHERTWSMAPAQLTITDRLRGRSGAAGVARLYVHPDVPVRIVDEGALVGSSFVLFRADSPVRVTLSTCELADGFNRLRTSRYLSVEFVTCLHTTVQLPE